MNKYEIRLVLDVFYEIEAENEDSAIEKAMEYADEAGYDVYVEKVG